MDPVPSPSNSGLLPPPSPRQHSVPTFSDEVKAALAAFAQVDPAAPHTAVPPALMRVIPDIAHTGLTCYEWPQLKVLVMFQLDQKLQQFNQQHPDIQPQFDQYRGRILAGLNNFAGVPFTIQRICEIIVRGENFYRSTKKIVFALEKLVTISTTQDTLQPHDYNHAVVQQQQAISNLPKNSVRYPADEIASAPLSDILDSLAAPWFTNTLDSLIRTSLDSSIGGVATIMPRQGTPAMHQVGSALAEGGVTLPTGDLVTVPATALPLTGSAEASVPHELVVAPTLPLPQENGVPAGGEQMDHQQQQPQVVPQAAPVDTPAPSAMEVDQQGISEANELRDLVFATRETMQHWVIRREVLYR